MNRVTLAGAVPVLCLLLAGCGSSESTGSTETTTVTVGGRTTTAVIKNGKAVTQPASGLKADTTPKFASPSANAPVQSGTVRIEYRNIAINPDVLRVKVGSTVKWTNYDPVEANVTSEGGPLQFKSKTLHEGESFELKMTKPGVIHYESTLHPVTQNGTIEVTS